MKSKGESQAIKTATAYSDKRDKQLFARGELPRRFRDSPSDPANKPISGDNPPAALPSLQEQMPKPANNPLAAPEKAPLVQLKTWLVKNKIGPKGTLTELLNNFGKREDFGRRLNESLGETKAAKSEKDESKPHDYETRNPAAPMPVGQGADYIVPKDMKKSNDCVECSK